MDRNMQVPLEQKTIESKSLNQFADKDRSELYGDLNKLPQGDIKNQQRLIDNGVLPNLCLSDSNPFDDSRRLDNAKDASKEQNRTIDNAEGPSASPGKLLDGLKEALSEPTSTFDELKDALSDPGKIVDNLKDSLSDFVRNLNYTNGAPADSRRRPITENPHRTPEQAEQSRNAERPDWMMDPSRRTERAKQTFDPNVWITE